MEKFHLIKEEAIIEVASEVVEAFKEEGVEVLMELVLLEQVFMRTTQMVGLIECMLLALESQRLEWRM